MKEHPNYEVFEAIGKGSTASVYRAHDLSLKRDVAIKELHEKFRKDPRRMQDFCEEAQFLAGIRHENIVQIHGIDQERGWIIMELMRNSLDNLVDQKGLPADLVRSVLQQALEALKCLHERKKLHAGIRPASLLIDDHGRIKLSDSAGITVGGEFRKPDGSSKYLAPELVNPQFGEVGPGVDLYNLGFAALELLLGRQAFEKLFKGVGPGAVDPEIGWMRWHSSMTEKLPSARELIPSLPEDMSRVLQRLTRKEVKQRYATADEALKDLESRDLVLVKEEDRGRKAARKAQDGPPVVAIGAAAPATPAQAAPRPAPPPPKTKPAATAAAKPWSKAWLNRQRKKPAIFIPLLMVLSLLIAYMAFIVLFPPDPPPTDVLFLLDSKPTGAAVSIYLPKKTGEWEWRQLKNRTKISLNLPPGEYKFKLELPEYETLTKTINVTKEETFVFDLKSKTSPPEPRRVTLASNPPGAEIHIDGKKIDKVTGEEIDAPPIPYQLKLVYKGKTFLDRKITSAEEERTVWPVPAMPRLVEIRSEPPGAYVILNGKKEERLTNDKFEVPSESLDIVLKKDKFKDFRMTYEKVPDNLPVFKLIPGEDDTRLVHIGSDPPGATVFINNIKQPKPTPDTYRAPKGPFSLRLEKGKRILAETVSVAGDKEVFKLPPTLRPLLIETTPPGAVVFIDREKQEKVTNDSYMVPDDTFDLELKGPENIPGVVPFKKKMKATDVVLEHAFKCQLYLKSMPVGATVFIDDMEQPQKTNNVFQVPAVPFSLKVVLGTNERVTSIEPTKLKPGSKDKEVPEVELELLPPGIQFALKTTPAGAKIVIQRKEAKPEEHTGPAKVTLPAGDYPVLVSMKGFKTVNAKLRVELGMKDLEFTLPPLVAMNHAFLVGVHQYGNVVPDFLHAENDVEALGSLLQNADFSPERVTLLTQARGKTAAAQAPTAENILGKLKFLADTCSEVDTVWVGLFGQIITTEDGDFFWPDKGDKADLKTLVPMAKILNELKRCPAQTKVLLLDGWRFSYVEGLGDQGHAVREFRPAKENLSGTLLIASCEPGQKGYGHPDKRHGVFGFALLQGVAGGADKDGDDKITGTELEAYLQKVNAVVKALDGSDQTVSVEAPDLIKDAMTLAKISPPLKSFGLALAALEEGKAEKSHAEKSVVAERLLSEVLKASPGFVEALIYRGESLAYIPKRLDDAAADLKAALKLNPNMSLAWSHLGDIQLELGDAEAIASHTRAIELEPAFALAHRDRGLVYLASVQLAKGSRKLRDEASRGSLEKALEDLKKSVKLNPRLFLGWYDLGQAYKVKAGDEGGDYDMALEAFTRAVNLGRRDWDKEVALYHRAETYKLRAAPLRGSKDEDEKAKFSQDLRGALKDYSELASLKTDDPAFYHNGHGTLHQLLDNLPEAAKSFETATRLKTGFKEAFLNLGAIYNQMNELEKAIATLGKAIALDEKYARAHAYIYDAYAKMAKRETNAKLRTEHQKNADRHYKIAMSLGWKFK